jgi:hypothetical protein
MTPWLDVYDSTILIHRLTLPCYCKFGSRKLSLLLGLDPEKA